MESEHCKSVNNEYNVLSNKGFSTVHEEFMENGWSLKNNDKDLLIYSKSERALDDFTIKVTPSNILVSVPISNSNYLYSASFTDYYKACDFVSLHLNHIETHYKVISKKDDDDENDNYNDYYDVNDY